MKFLRHQSGIAIAPILFAVALLAILATAIAAGTSTFSAGSGQESARTLAAAMISQCRNYKAAIDRMLMGHGCDPYRLDLTPVAFPAGTSWTSGDFTSGNSTNRAGNGSCTLYDLRGGTLTFTRLPDSALGDSTALVSGVYGNAQMAYWFGYPMISGTHCIPNVGTCPLASRKGTLTLHYTPIRQDVCEQINAILKNGITATASVININDSATYNAYAGWNLRGMGINTVGTTGGTTGSTVQEMCAKDIRSLTGGDFDAFVYYCTLLVQ